MNSFKSEVCMYIARVSLSEFSGNIINVTSIRFRQTYNIS